MSWKNISQPRVVVFKLCSMKLPQESHQGRLVWYFSSASILFYILGFPVRFYLKKAASWSPSHKSLETSGVIERAQLQEV